MKIVTADITGSLIVNGVDVTNNVVSSSVFSGSIAGRVTSLEQFSASLDATFATDASVTASILVLSQSVQASQAALSSSYTTTSGSYVAISGSYVSTSGSYAAASASLSTRVTNTEATASTNTQASASFAAYSGSMSTRLTTDETNITTLTNASSSFAAQSASLSTRLTTDETNYTNLSSSFATTSGSAASRLNVIETSYATTGSNIFTGTQRITQASNAISFTSTASLYTDGGLRVSKDSYVSGTAYFNNVVVYGTSSIQYITSSQVNFGTNIITVNTDTPAVRFGGLAVFDSGSTQLTGSMLWDSEKNNWIYSNPSGSTYSGGMIISGPRNTGSLGNEQGTTGCALMMGQGGDHITSSAIFSYGNATCFYGQSYISSSGATCFNGSVTAGSDIVLTATNGNIYGGTADGSAIFSNNGGSTYARFYGPSHATTPNVTAFINANGTSMTINASGNVGLGVTPLQILSVGTTCWVTGQESVLVSQQSVVTEVTRISTYAENSGGYAGLMFKTLRGGGDGLATRMYISSIGNVGIGTTNPQAKLHVSGSIIVGSDACYNLISGPSTGAAIQLGTNSATFNRNLNLGFVAADLSFGPILTINAQTNNIGIGNCTPDRRLYITDTSAAQGTFLAYNQCSTFCGTVIEGITDRTSSSAFNLMNLKASTTSMFLVRGDGQVCAPSFTGGAYSGTCALFSDYISVAASTGGSSTFWGNLCISNNKCAYFTGVSTFLTDITGKGAFNGYAGATQNLLLDWSSESQVTTLTNTNLFFGTNAQRRVTISNTGITCFACQICAPTMVPGNIAMQGGNSSSYICFYSLYSGSPANPGFVIANTSGQVTLTHNSNGGTTTSLGTICGLSSVYTATNFRVGSGTSAGNTVDPAITTGGCTKVGIWYSNNCVGFGAGGYGLYMNGTGAAAIDSGVIYSNGVVTYTVGGTMQGTTATYFDFPAWNDGGQGQIFEIKTFFEHFYNWGYGASMYKYMAARESSTQDLTIFNCPTGNGGSWIAYKPDTTTLRVCKIAGSYVGGGAYWIQVVAKMP